MLNVILKFVSCNRAAGLRISTSEVLDCLRQLEIIDPLHESRFKIVLRANFAKSRREQEAFDRLYHLFFHGMELGLQGDKNLCKEGWGQEAASIPDKIAQFVVQFREATQEIEPKENYADGLDQALIDFLAGNPLAFIHEVFKIHNRDEPPSKLLKSNLGQLSLRLDAMLRINRLKTKTVQFLGSHYGKIVAEADDGMKTDIHDLKEAVKTRLNKALEFLTTEPRLDNTGLVGTGSRELHYKTIGEIPFSNLTQEEAKAVKEIIDRLVQKFKDITSRRFSAAGRGRMDVKKTIQRSVKYLGVPLEIVPRVRPLSRGKIVVLCDVSGSVWSAARFMLNILYSLQTCFSLVKSYVFIERPFEVSSFFVSNEPNEGIKKILNDTRINYDAKTDYGMVFQQFRDCHFKQLDKKTTLIIIGDARSNYFNPRELLLESMRERCRRLIWLNPEPKKFWGTGDSEMMRYQNHCNEARVCCNLNQLIDFIEALVL